MSRITDLNQILRSLNPTMCGEEFVFICRSHEASPNETDRHAVASVFETEGRTLVVPKRIADEVGETYSAVFRRITLQVHSSLEAVGLTAAVSNQLLQYGIAANLFAGFHHDHVFVPSSRANAAMSALQEFESETLT